MFRIDNKSTKFVFIKDVMKDMLIYLSLFFYLFFINQSCTSSSEKIKIRNEQVKAKIIVGAEQTEKYFPLLEDKKVGVVANHTSLIGNTNIVDSLLNAGVKITKIFSPEHGFRGSADAGEALNNSIDELTGLSIISLYGKNYKPSKESLKGIDIILFDIQDVGVRFYTYISTMHYVMEACAENNIEFVILDRPNPNGYYVDGPVLEQKHKSFVGLHPVPIVHGMTIAEYARMINGEYWLKDSAQCKLKVIKCKNYDHSKRYKIPVSPSPNLQNMTSIYLYPFLGIFEGTCISVGRGTDFPFQVFGHPDMKNSNFSFIPESRPGSAKNPKFKGKKCYGFDLRYDTIIGIGDTFRLEMIKYAYRNMQDKDKFFNLFFTNLAGTEELKQQIINNVSSEQIRKSWKHDIEKFLEIRKRYLLYPDFIDVKE